MHDHDHEEDDGVQPKLTFPEFEKLTRSTIEDGRVQRPELHGSWSNAKQAADDPAGLCQSCRESSYLDRGGHDANRELANDIEAAFKKWKTSDQHGPQFILAWRLYAHKDHPRFKESDGCGCGCGCHAPKGPYKPPGC
jgi:hypothetical protein